MNLNTPLGEIIILLDDEIIEYKYQKLDNEKHCLDVEGRYIINVLFKPDGKEHRITCYIKNHEMSKNDEIETGEDLELKSFYKDNIKLSIGMEGDTGYIDGKKFNEYYDYDNNYLDNGVQYVIFKETKTINYIFGIAWIKDYDKDNEIQTWFGADPTLYKFGYLNKDKFILNERGYEYEEYDYNILIKESIFDDDTINYVKRIRKKYIEKNDHILNYILESGLREFYKFNYTDEYIKNNIGKPTIIIDSRKDDNHPQWKFEYSGIIEFYENKLDEHIISIEFVDSFILDDKVQING